MTLRLEQAINKLYAAFHAKTLNPECCIHCAVGNILDNKDAWKHLSDEHGSLKLNYVGKVNEMMGRRFNGYLPSELLTIEMVFLKGCGYEVPLYKRGRKGVRTMTQDQLFNGLYAAIDYLCTLDNVDHIMECVEVFDLSINPTSEKSRTYLPTY